MLLYSSTENPNLLMRNKNAWWLIWKYCSAAMILFKFQWLISLIFMYLLNPSSVINKNDAKESASTSESFLSSLQIIISLISSNNKWYNSWANVNFCLPLEWFELIPIIGIFSSLIHKPLVFLDIG